MSIIGKGLAVAGKAIDKTGITQKANSPEAFVGVGIGLMVLGTVSACKATISATAVLEKATEDLKTINDASEKVEELGEPERYPAEKQTKDKMTVAVQTTVGMMKVYSPSFILFAGGVASVLCGFNILKGRHLAMIAAYKAVDGSYKAYRRSVVAELGDEADRRFRHGIEKKELEVPKLDKEGNETGKTVKKTVDTVKAPEGYSEYARYFDESCPEWQKNPEYNKMFLRTQEAIANDMLHSRGHVFLNEVYDMLGFERTEAGTAVGWKLGMGDDYIDFGIFDIYNVASRNFVNGIEPVILLDFNVDGPIYDQI